MTKHYMISEEQLRKLEELANNHSKSLSETLSIVAEIRHEDERQREAVNVLLEAVKPILAVEKP
jgi:hypothetical protein